MSYRSGLQMFAIITNWKTEFHKPLTHPGVNHDEEMSICSSIPQAHRGYINSSLLESDLTMSESHANVVSFDENVSTLSNLYERNEHLLRLLLTFWGAFREIFRKRAFFSVKLQQTIYHRKGNKMKNPNI